jgi:osmotically-inducible protein OsmY
MKGTAVDMHKPNNLLEFDVKDEFDWDPQLDPTRIVVKADDGRVTLTGSVPTLYQVERATDDTMLVGGVKAIDNELLVGLVGDAINDAELAVAATAALNDDSLVPKGAVTPDVLDGFVTLNGNVRHHFQRLAAEHAVRRVDGVLGITSHITLTSEPIPGDVANRINKAFQRSAIIDDSQITVSNDGPTIYLDGTAARGVLYQSPMLDPGVRYPLYSEHQRERAIEAKL